jgi:hypothetical protein
LRRPPRALQTRIATTARQVRNAVIAALLRSHATDIERFVEHDEYTFLAIGFYTAATSR